MSRFYQDLHDRELLAQALTLLQEVHRRKLLDIYLPPSEEIQTTHPIGVFPRRPASITVESGRLALVLEQSFFGRT